MLFFFTDPPPPEIYTLSLHDALPISAADMVRLAPKVAYGSLARQVALVRWTPQDPHSGHPVASAAAAASAPTERAAAPSRSKLEERFDSGWKNWVGGVEDWCVDAAGVRT